MPLPLVMGYHLVWTAYVWWLPNDPRGSMSNCIRYEILSDLGELRYGRKKIQPASIDIRKFYEAAAAKLDHPLLSFQPAVALCETLEGVAGWVRVRPWFAKPQAAKFRKATVQLHIDPC